MDTLMQESSPVLAASGLSGSVAVAVGALVVVLAIVLVFVMVLRSNGAARKTAGGLGYDAQRGPLGQPQADGSASPWQRQSAQQAPGWAQNGDLGAVGAPSGARANAAAWGPTQDFPGNAGAAGGMPGGGRWNPAQGQAQQQSGGWDAAPAGAASAERWGAPPSAAGDDPWQTGGGGNSSDWNAPQPQASRPAAGMPGMNGASAGWDMPAAGGAGAGRSPWGAADNSSGPAPWDQPPAAAPDWAGPAAAPGRGGPNGGANAGMNGGWSADVAPAAPGASDWGAPVGGSAAEWGAPPAAAPRPDWNAAPVAPQGAPGFDVAGGGYGEADKTRVVRPSGQQSQGMIVVRQGKEPGRIFEVRKERLTIGRSRESDIFLEDLAVSRLHTTVARDNSGRYLLRDENSANGTYVNGQRISEHVLDEGDEIQVGQTVLAFVRR